MIISVSNIIAFAKRRRRTTFAIGAALVTTLSFGAAEMVAQMKNAEFDANIASPASAQTLPAPIAGMALSEFLAATRATRFLPSERTWWSRKGDAKPKAFAAIADPMEDPAGDGLPEGVKPVAFSALAPTGGPVGGVVRERPVRRPGCNVGTAGRGGDPSAGAWIARRRADAATGKRLAVLAVGTPALAIP